MSITKLHAQGIIEIPPVDFGGGLNMRSSPNLIADNESPDMLNMINTFDHFILLIIFYPFSQTLSQPWARTFQKSPGQPEP